MAQLEVQWALMRWGLQPLTERDAHKLTTGLYATWLEMFSENPSEQTLWRTDLYPHLWPRLRTVADLDFAAEADLAMMRQVSFATAEGHLRECGLQADEFGHLRFQKAGGAVIAGKPSDLKVFQGKVFPGEVIPTPRLAGMVVERWKKNRVLVATRLETILPRAACSFSAIYGSRKAITTTVTGPRF